MLLYNSNEQYMIGRINIVRSQTDNKIIQGF